MHALPAPFPEDDTVQKRQFLFLVCVFSRNKAVHVDYFDFKVCGYAFFLFQNSAMAVMFSGCNNILDIMVSIILSLLWILSP